jgi:hypothetical protein
MECDTRILNELLLLHNSAVKLLWKRVTCRFVGDDFTCLFRYIYTHTHTHMLYVLRMGEKRYGDKHKILVGKWERD